MAVILIYNNHILCIILWHLLQSEKKVVFQDRGTCSPSLDDFQTFFGFGQKKASKLALIQQLLYCYVKIHTEKQV